MCSNHCGTELDSQPATCGCCPISKPASTKNQPKHTVTAVLFAWLSTTAVSRQNAKIWVKVGRLWPMMPNTEGVRWNRLGGDVGVHMAHLGFAEVHLDPRASEFDERGIS